MTRPLRIAVGQLIQESNSFAPGPTTREHFEAQGIARGAALLARAADARIEIGGMVATLREAGAEPVPLLAAHGSCGGPLTRACFDGLVDDLLAAIAAAGRLDAVLLALHGAMAVEDEPDAESEILERVRAVLPPGTPVGVSLDLHGHVTPRMLQPGVFFVGYQNYPHTDLYETGERTARLLLDTLAGRRRPVMALAKRPMIVSPANGRTLDGPLAEVAAAARALEARGPVLHASLFPVQPWLDFEDLGFGVLVCADADRAAAQAAAEQLADLAWERRERMLPDLAPLDDAIRLAHAQPGLTVVGDCGDAPSGGAAGDEPHVLSRLLALGIDRAPRPTYLTLVDPPAAAAAGAAGPGATLDLRLGHAVGRGGGEPLAVSATVKALTDGRFTMTTPGMAGVELNLGLTAVLAIGSIRVAVRSIGALEWDTAQFTSVGLELSRAALIFVKSPSHFRGVYGPIAQRLLTADTPGATACNIRRVPYTKVRRPIHPLDPV